MGKANFYILNQQHESDRQFFACRLVEKAFNMGHFIYLHTDSENSAQQIDDLLWSFKPESFLPHAIDKVMDDDDIPIIIGYGQDYSGPMDMLINLGSSPPGFYQQFKLVSEIVLNDEADKQLRREHWNTYKNQGFEMQRHQL
ncbi:MAG: DNA polymerase III subunit chi [Pseudohongiellaceae bacterium]